MRSAGSSHSARATPGISIKPSESTTYGRIIEGTRCGLGRLPTSPTRSSTRLPTPLEDWSSLRRKEPLDQLAACLRFNAALHVHAVIQPRMPHQIPHRPAHPRLLIVCPKHQCLDLGEYNRPRALRARLDRHVQRAVGEPVSL